MKRYILNAELRGTVERNPKGRFVLFCEAAELLKAKDAELTRLRLLETGIVKPLLALLADDINVDIFPRYSNGEWQVLLSGLSVNPRQREFIADTLPEALQAAQKAKGETDE